MDNDNASKENKPEIIKNTTFHDLIEFKEDILKLMKDMKSEVITKLTTEFKNYNTLMDNTQKKFSLFEKSFLSKLNYIEEKEKIFSKIKNIESELENNLMKQNIIINNCSKDLRNACFKYDKIIMDNLYIPSLIGHACQFPNLKEYILANKDTLDNCISFNKQKDMDLKLFKSKIDDNIIKFNFQTKTLLDNNNQLIKIKIEDFEKKFYDNLNEFQSAIKKLSLNINQNTIKINEKEIKNDETFEILKKVQKQSDKNQNNISNLFYNVNVMKNDISNIKKNLIHIISLLSQSNKNLEKDYNDIINNIKNKINLENNNYIYERSEANINNSSKNNVNKNRISKLYSIDNIFNHKEKMINDALDNNLNIHNRLFRRFNSNRNSKKNLNIVIQNSFNKNKNLILSNNKEPKKSLVLMGNHISNDDLNFNNLIINKKTDLGNTNISSSENESNKSYNSNDNKETNIKENINNIKSNSININSNKNNYFIRNQKMSYSIKKTNELSKENSNSLTITSINKKEKNENIQDNKKIKSLFYVNNENNKNNIENTDNDIKSINKEGNFIKNINTIISNEKDNQNTINKDITNKNVKDIDKKNLFSENILKNKKKNETKLKILQKNLSDFNSPMIIKNINDIIKQNTFTKKDDLSNKKISIPKLKNDDIKNFINFNNNFISQEKDDKNIFKKYINQRNITNENFRFKNTNYHKFESNINGLSYDKNIDEENNKEIYLHKDIINKLKCVKDQELIDKPLIIHNKKNDFIYDPKKSTIENRIIELEYFTKKKFDELVQEIKLFIPIHFNSHIRNYTLMKKKK